MVTTQKIARLELCFRRKLGADSTVDNRPWRQSIIYLTVPGIELRFHQP